jgi:putative transposase
MDKTFYRRHLPHYTPQGVDYFITYHLAGSLPRAVLDRLRDQHRQWVADLELQVKSGLKTDEETTLRAKIRKQYFAAYDLALEHDTNGPHWLREERVAKIVRDGFHQIAEEGHFDLWCYTIMSNHVHVLFQHPSAGADNESITLSKTMQLVKGRSAFSCNQVLSRRGAFWQDESFDHVVREGEFERIVLYILNNPVKAGLVKHWSEWPWSYVHPEVRKLLLL